MLENTDESHLEEIASALKEFNGGSAIQDVYVSADRVIMRSKDVISNLSRILNHIEDQGGEINNMAIRNTTLEDVFIHLTGRALRN